MNYKIGTTFFQSLFISWLKFSILYIIFVEITLVLWVAFIKKIVFLTIYLFLKNLLGQVWLASSRLVFWQSTSPSHFHAFGIHSAPGPHWNSPSLHLVNSTSERITKWLVTESQNILIYSCFIIFNTYVIYLYLIFKQFNKNIRSKLHC